MIHTTVIMLLLNKQFVFMLFTTTLLYFIETNNLYFMEY